MYFLCCACDFIHCFPVPFINEHEVEVNVLCSKYITALMMEDTKSLELFPLCLLLSFFAFTLHLLYTLTVLCFLQRMRNSRRFKLKTNLSLVSLKISQINSPTPHVIFWGIFATIHQPNLCYFQPREAMQVAKGEKVAELREVPSEILLCTVFLCDCSKGSTVCDTKPHGSGG